MKYYVKEITREQAQDLNINGKTIKILINHILVKENNKWIIKRLKLAT